MLMKPITVSSVIALDNVIKFPVAYLYSNGRLFTKCSKFVGVFIPFRCKKRRSCSGLEVL